MNNPDPNYNEDYLWTKDSGIRGLIRGGYWNNKADAGVYAMHSAFDPSYVGSGIGFRCVKWQLRIKNLKFKIFILNS